MTSTTIFNFINTKFSLVINILKGFMIFFIEKFFPKLLTYLFNRYPLFYKFVDNIFGVLTAVYSYIYNISFKLHTKLKNNYPILYSIILYVYTEYLAIIHGNLSSNMKVIIGLYVVFDPTYTNIIIYGLLLINKRLKENLIKYTGLKENYPVLYEIILDLISLINTILLFYMIDLIFINVIKPFALKLWNGFLKMANGEENNNNNDSDSPEGNFPKKPKLPDGYYYDKNGKKTKKRAKMKAWDEKDPDCYINKSGRKVRKKPKRTQEDRENKNAWERDNYRIKLESEGKTLKEKLSFVGLTDKETKDLKAKRKRDWIKGKKVKEELKYIEENDLYDKPEHWEGMRGVKFFGGKADLEKETEDKFDNDTSRAIEESKKNGSDSDSNHNGESSKKGAGSK